MENAFVVQPTRAELWMRLDMATNGDFGEQIVGLLETYPDKFALHTTISSLDGDAVELLTRDMVIRRQLPKLSTLHRKITTYEVLEVETILMEIHELWPESAWTVEDALEKRVKDLADAIENDDDETADPFAEFTDAETTEYHGWLDSLQA